MDEDIAGATMIVEIFSDLLRYQLYNPDEMVPIEQEIQCINSYIQLQKLRLSENLDLKVTYDIELKDQKIYILWFLPLIENAFKYSGGKLYLNMELGKNGNWIEFYIENSKDSLLELNKFQQGIGLENLRRRLELIYPNKHSLIIHASDVDFKVILKLKYA
ncbi:histidine kinase [Rhizosphaericola mali]|uniref:Signal transduction histidine kinase internal region domain-containing protein n=1 Tax=Rhizosphaericola mali TaxID=2545455 RepID=A0A5P2G1J6_9BACT|nr:histidine kinase [Rhizosphaericola mali]QES89676.1 hypothetical protein E0W69_013735 [Rhizosphaericola mali]